MKKYLSLVLAALLIMGVLAGCGEQGSTQAPDNSSTPIRTQATLPADGSFTSEEYEKLLTLRFVGYEEMTVAEFRDKVGAASDTKEYTNLFEQLPKDAALQELKDTDEDAEFLFYVLPLAGDDWKTRSYSGEVTSSYTGDKARLEYSFTLTILNPDVLWVKDYNDTRLGVMNVMQDTLRNKTKDELRDEAAIRADVQFQIDHLLQSINQTAELSAAIEFAYFPLPATEERPQVSGANENGNQEPRRAEHGTKEDYQSLLALKTPDYPRSNSGSKLLYSLTHKRSIVSLVILQPITGDIEVLEVPCLTVEVPELIEGRVFLNQYTQAITVGILDSVICPAHLSALTKYPLLTASFEVFLPHACSPPLWEHPARFPKNVPQKRSWPVLGKFTLMDLGNVIARKP